ncbi:response regulator transcription factor [Thiohalorhabdus sp. Cl-TMA]|uniref:Response regulator transcription factor n=1 Tax=Thiohalorhabdus methylotrophus TaxID=3242694 RepID=A0ABV4TVP4_9GAMM
MPNKQRGSTVFVVDDDPYVLDSTRWLLENSGFHTETHDHAESFFAAYRNETTGCVILDIRMPGMTGLALQNELVKIGAEIPIVFITAHGDIPQTVQAMKLGAWDFIEKPYDPRQLLESVERAVEWSEMRQDAQRRRALYANRFSKLSPREQEVAREVAGGRSSKEIARRLQLSPRTVETHRYRLMEKVGAGSVAHLVLMLMEIGEEVRIPE